MRSSCAVFKRRLRVHARKRIERVVHHLGDLPAEVLDLAVLVGGPLHGREARGDVADLLALVADALEIGDGLDDRDDHPQVAGGGRAQREDAAALLVDRDLHAVDLVVVGRHRFAEAAVALDQRGDRLVQLLLDEAAHLQHLVAHLFQVLVEPLGNVVVRSAVSMCLPCDIQTLKVSESRVRLHPIAAAVNS
jgi:hypothetical protein